MIVLEELEGLKRKAQEIVKGLDINKVNMQDVKIDRFNYDFITGYPPISLLPQISDPKGIFNGLNVSKVSSAYIHIPFCSGFCSYCYFVKVCPNDRELVKEYLEALKNEMNLFFSLTGRQKPSLTSLYIGGGTPTFLTGDEITELFGFIEGYLQISSDAEIFVLE